MTTVDIVNTLPTPAVSRTYTILSGSWSQTTGGLGDTATISNGAGGDATARTLESADPLFTVPEYGYVPFFSISMQADLVITEKTLSGGDTILYDIGGSGTASASLAFEIPGILDCSYEGSISTTCLNDTSPSGCTTYDGTFSLTFLGATTTTTAVPLGGYNGWFPGSLSGRIPLKLTVEFGEVYSPGTVICVATIRYPYTNFGSYSGTTTYDLVLNAGDGITGTELATPGDYNWLISASHYQAADDWEFIPSSDPYLEMVDSRVYVGEPLPPPVTAGVDVRGVSVELCGPGSSSPVCE